MCECNQKNAMKINLEHLCNLLACHTQCALLNMLLFNLLIHL